VVDVKVKGLMRGKPAPFVMEPVNFALFMEIDINL